MFSYFSSPTKNTGWKHSRPICHLTLTNPNHLASRQDRSLSSGFVHAISASFISSCTPKTRYRRYCVILSSFQVLVVCSERFRLPLSSSRCSSSMTEIFCFCLCSDATRIFTFTLLSPSLISPPPKAFLQFTFMVARDFP